MKHSLRLDTRLRRLLRGQRLSRYPRPPEQAGTGGAFESDMRLTSEQRTHILLSSLRYHPQQGEGQALSSPEAAERGAGGSGQRWRRKAVAHKSYLWPSRVVPYTFHHSFPEDYQDTVLEAMQFWQRNTCLLFVPFSETISEYLRHADHVLFKTGHGCQSSIGRIGTGQQTTEIAVHCNGFGSVSHELGHILGFYHEQSRPDRDEHVMILRDNIRKGREHNFLKYATSEILTDEPYDIGSVMHYGPTYFSRNEEALTIDTQDESLRSVMGQRNAPSFMDVKTANHMYTCNDNCHVWPECSNMGYVGPDCTCMCPTGLSGWDCTEVMPSTADCGGVMHGGDGTIQSPEDIDGYPSNIDCLWLLQGAPGSTSIWLTFDHFELEDDSVQPCAFDWLEVRTQGPHLNGQRFCGEGPAQDIVYQGDAIVIHFHTDDTYNFRGFKLRYEIHDGYLGEASATENFLSSIQAQPTSDPWLTHWTPWSHCSTLCGGGWRSRVRTCIHDYCDGLLYEDEPCNQRACDDFTHQEGDEHLGSKDGLYGVNEYTDNGYKEDENTGNEYKDGEYIAIISTE